MNILLVTNNLYPTGGDWSYVKQTYDLYQKYGHNVYLFGLNSKNNVDNTYQEYYVTSIDLHKAKKHPLKYGLKVLSASLYSKEAIKNIERFVTEFKIDVVQINSIHLGVTASIIRKLFELNIPIVYRIIDYSQVCPNIHMVRNGKICTDCLGNKFFNCVKHNCKKSLLTSLFVSLNAYFYTIRGDYKLIDMYSFQNDFMRNLFVKCGYDPQRAITINNHYNSSNIIPDYTLGEYVLFIARIEPEKGIMTFLKAASLNPTIKHVVVGTGSLDDIVKEKINKTTNVEYLGSVWGEALDKIIKKSRFVVCPSEWEEPSSYVAFQSFACGKPVIASNRGGLPEVVKDNYNGLIVESGNAENLSKVIRALYNDGKRVTTLGRNARYTVETDFSPELYYKETIRLFETLIANHRKLINN